MSGIIYDFGNSTPSIVKISELRATELNGPVRLLGKTQYNNAASLNLSNVLDTLTSSDLENNQELIVKLKSPDADLESHGNQLISVGAIKEVVGEGIPGKVGNKGNSTPYELDFTGIRRLFQEAGLTIEVGRTVVGVDPEITFTYNPSRGSSPKFTRVEANYFYEENLLLNGTDIHRE